MSDLNKNKNKKPLGFGLRKPAAAREDIITAENQISFADFFNSCYLDEIPWFFTALKQEQTSEKPKVGFGLNKMKEEKPATGKQKKVEPEPETNRIDVLRTQDELNKILGKWFGRQMVAYQQQRHYAVQIHIGRITDDDEIKTPLLVIPVWLQVSNRNVGYEIRGNYNEYSYHPAGQRLAERFSFSLPELPSILEDFNPDNFLADIKELLIPHQQLTLESAFQLVLQPPPKKLKEETNQTNSRILPVPGNNIATWQSMLDSGFIPATYTASQIAVVDQAYSGASFQISGNSVDDAKTMATLTTLLAYQGKKVLLLGEDNFRIENVYKQLEKNHIHEFCLPLHKVKTRRDLTNILSNSVDQTWENQKTKPVDNQKIRKLLSNISKYETAWKSAFGELGMSPGQLTATLAQKNKIPTLPIPVPDAGLITRDDILKWKKVLVSYQQTKKVIGDVSEHPWKHSELTEFDESKQQKVEELFDHTAKQIHEAQRLLKDICKFTGAEAPANFTEILPFLRIIRMLLNAPPTEADALIQIWNPLPDFITTSLKLLKEARFKLKEMSMYFHADIIQENLDEILPELEKTKSSFTRFFNWKYQKTVERLLNYGVNKSLDENEMFWHNLRKALEIKKIREKLRKHESKLKLYFDDDWEGLGTDVEYLEDKISWYQEFDKRAKQYPWLKSKMTIAFILGVKGKTEARVESLEPLLTELQDSLVQIRTRLKLTKDDPLHFYSRHDLQTIVDLMNERIEQMPYLKSWCAFRNLEESVAEPFVREFLDKAPKRKDIPLAQYPEVFEKLILEHILQAARADRPVLDLMTPELLEKQLSLLSDYILRLRFNTGPMMKEHFREARQQAVTSDSTTASAELLRHELQKHARRNPVSKTLRKTFNALTEFAPVWSIRKNQWEEFGDLIQDFDVIIHLGGSLPDTIPANAQLIQSKSAIKINNLPSVDQENHPLYPRLFKKHLPVESYPIPSSSISEQKIAWQILDHALHFTEEEDNKHHIVIAGEDQNYSEKFWAQIAEYANTKREIRDQIAEPSALGDYIFILDDAWENHHPADVFVLDACTTASKPKTGFGFKKATLPDLNYEKAYQITDGEIHAFSNEKSVLQQIESKISEFQEPESDKPRYFADLLKNGLPAHWELTPLPEPGVAHIRHNEFEELRFIIWSEADDDNVSLWNLYDEIINSGATPVLFSGLHHLPIATQRVNEIKQLLEEALRETILLKERAQEEEKIKAQKEQEVTESDKTEDQEDQLEASEQETKAIHYTDSVIDQLINTTPTNTDLNFKKAGKQRKAPILDFNELPKLKSYELHQGVNMGSREDFLDASDKQIQKLLFDIVKTESPIYWRNLMRCFASYWQIQRLSQNVEAILFRGISSLLESNKIFAKDGCLYDNPEFNFKVRNRADTIAYHRPDELPIDECEMALFMVMEQFYPIPIARLYDAAAHILGFKRADRVLEEQFRKALSRMAQQDTVQEGDYGLQLKPSLYKSSMRMPQE